MALDSLSFDPKIVGDSTFVFNALNASDQAICYLLKVQGIEFSREFNIHRPISLPGLIFTSLRDSGIELPISGEIQTFEPDRYWRTVYALRTALQGTATTGRFSFYLHEDGGTNEWRLDQCAYSRLKIEAWDDQVHRAEDGRYPRWAATITSEQEEPTIISGGETISGGAPTGILVIDQSLKLKGIVVVDDTDTVHGKLSWESGPNKCVLRIDGDMEVYPGKVVALPS